MTEPGHSPRKATPLQVAKAVFCASRHPQARRARERCGDADAGAGDHRRHHRRGDFCAESGRCWCASLPAEPRYYGMINVREFRGESNMLNQVGAVLSFRNLRAGRSSARSRCSAWHSAPRSGSTTRRGASSLLIAGLLILFFMLAGWFTTVAHESEAGKYNKQVDTSFRWGMSWFIFSEVMFFAAFFGALFYMRVLSVPDLGGLETPAAAVARLQGGLAGRRPRHHGAVHADGRLGHSGAQYAAAAVVRRDGDLGALGPAQEQPPAADLGPGDDHRARHDLPRLPDL